MRGTRPAFGSPAPFDPDKVEALDWRQIRVALMIEDNDPNPDDVTQVMLRTPLGQWPAQLTPAGTWEVEGQALGPVTARACDMLRAYAAAEGGLSKYQGPDAAARYGH